MKTDLVTGASGEIGAAIAKEFAAAGYALALHGAKHIENVNQLAETFKSNGIEAYPVCGDLSDPAACERVWADTENTSAYNSRISTSHTKHHGCRDHRHRTHTAYRRNEQPQRRSTAV